MLRKAILYGGTLLLVVAAILAIPDTGWAHGGGGGGGHGGGGFGGGHGGGGHFGGGHFGGFGGGHFGGFRGGHFGGFRGGHFGGFGGGFHRGIYGYPHAYHHRGFSGFYPYFGFYGYYPYSYNDYPYVWSDPAYGSGYYDPYWAGTPTYLNGDAYAVPPAANSQPDPIAHLTVNVPAGARLWLDGTPTTRTGPVRLFVSPPLTPGGRYSYQIRASWDENGHETTQTQTVEVTAGSHVSVNFPMPSQTAGQTSDLPKE